jgi:hypothetical protein
MRNKTPDIRPINQFEYIIDKIMPVNDKIKQIQSIYAYIFYKIIKSI